MRNPQIDVTNLVARLRGVGEDYYANSLEDVAAALDQADGVRLSAPDVAHFDVAIAELEGGNTEEGEIASTLREFVNKYK